MANRHAPLTGASPGATLRGMTSAAISTSEYRDLAARWLTHVCGGSSGRSEQDPVYRRVTENRDDGRPHGYSSCGDLAHAMYQFLGVTAPWLNRAPHWTSGANVSRLAFGAYAKTDADDYALWAQPVPPDGRPYGAGDVLVVWSRPDTKDAHVMCVLEHRSDAGVLTCAEYGQPGGRVRNHTIVRRPITSGLGTSLGLRRITDAYWINDSNKAIVRALRLNVVLEGCAASGWLADIDGPAQLKEWGIP